VRSSGGGEVRVGATTPHSSLWPDLEMVTKLKVAVVGARRGAVHVAAFQAHPASEVVVVCDTDRARAEGVAKRNGVEGVVTRYEEVLARRDIDVIALATADADHAPQAMLALDAGKHVLTEIPMAVELEQCELLIAAVKRSGKHLQMAQQVRWAPYVLAAKALRDEGEFGEIFYAEGEYFHNVEGYLRGPQGERTWRSDNPYAGILGGGPHPYDTLRWLTGVEFTEVHAYSVKPVGGLDRVADDHFTALFKASGRSGATAKVAVSSGLARPYSLYLSVYGTEGTWERDRHQDGGSANSDDYLFLRKIPNLRQMMRMPSSRSRYHSFTGIIPDGGLPSDMGRAFGTQGHGAHDAMPVADLMGAILDGRPPIIDVYEGARTCAGLRCALESCRTGAVVQIPKY
jgi:predicted dehydrogenase